MDLLGTSSTEKTSEGTGFASKIEQLKESITNLVTKSSEKKTGNMEKVDSIKNKIIKIKENLRNGLPTIPTILDDEIECNIFLKAKDLKSFSKLRDLKDNF